MIAHIHQLFVLWTTIFLKTIVEVFILITDVIVDYSENRLMCYP